MNLELLIDLHRNADYLGPGGEAETLRALALSRLAPASELAVADLGCGTGASALVLARALGIPVLALDRFTPFLERLADRAGNENLGDRLIPVAGDLGDLPISDASLDLLWAEGSIYNIGFEAGLQAWRRVLKPGGVLAVSEITWLGDARPPEIERHWTAEYPEIATAGTKRAQLERHGYRIEGWFPLPSHCWLDNYYLPMERRFDDFLERHGHSPDARAFVDAERAEIALYRRFGTHYSYGFYVASKR
jgi:SAM-dependent methyltransferase